MDQYQSDETNEFLVESYQPIDYTNWDFSGRGENVRPFLNEKEWEIWQAALPVQDKRDDTGQGEIVTYFTLELLKYIPSAQREIAVPTAILHDTGWGEIENPAKMHREAIKNNTVNTPAYRKIHQDAGVKVAKRILSDVGYPPQYIEPICVIIGDHDTRLYLKSAAQTPEAQIMSSPSAQIFMDADMLWRFTVPHKMAYLQNKSAQEMRTLMEEMLNNPKTFFTPAAFEVARREMENTLSWSPSYDTSS